MKEESIVKPTRLKDINVNRAFYLPFERPGSTIWEELENKSIKKRELYCGSLFYFPDALVLSRAMGAPAAVLSLEQLAFSGISEVVILGCCGAMDKKNKIGQVISVNLAYSDEGTSAHYFPRKKVFYPDKQLKNKLEFTLTSLGLPFSEGSLVSTDAPYRETAQWLARKKEKNIGYVDMETSAVFAWAEFRNIKTAALMIVSDLVEPIRWTCGFKRKEFFSQIRKCYLPILFTKIFSDGRYK